MTAVHTKYFPIFNISLNFSQLENFDLELGLIDQSLYC